MINNMTPAKPMADWHPVVESLIGKIGLDRGMKEILLRPKDKLCVGWVSEWLLFNTNSAFFQLYHGENKLIFNERMMRSALY